MGVAANGPDPLSDIAPRAPLLRCLEITPAQPARTCVSYSSLDLVPKLESFLFIPNSIYKFHLLNMEKISAASEKLVNS